MEDARQGCTPRGGETESVMACEMAIDNGNLALAATILRELMSPSDMDDAVRRHFGLHIFFQANEARKKSMIDRMRSLVGTPWAGIITTNYDELIEYALDHYSEVERIFASGVEPRLGSILNATPAGGMFFVKLHGSVTGTQIVLSTEEYDRTYIGTPQVRSFLTALMLRYHLVFIGCSLEDEIVRLRRELRHQFGGMIPTAYALLPDTSSTQMRSAWLRNLAQIETIPYPQSDRTHVSVDYFLKQTATCADRPSAANGRPDSLARFSKASVVERVHDVGYINQQILRLIGMQRERSLSHQELLNLQGHLDGEIRAALSDLSPEERIYRSFFLVSIGLLEERKSIDKRHKYIVPKAVWKSLCAIGSRAIELNRESRIK
jgi:hypothetical protein